MVRALASHQCSPGSTRGVMCGLSLLLVLILAPRGFSLVFREVFLQVLRFSPLLKNQHFQIPVRSGAHEYVLTSFQAPKCFVGKQITTNYKLQFPQFTLNDLPYIRC